MQQSAYTEPLAHSQPQAQQVRPRLETEAPQLVHLLMREVRPHAHAYFVLHHKVAVGQ
jgi:hypothetical protein